MTIALPGIAGLGWPELIIIVLVVLLLFGGKKLPEMARGTGRALRIFKAETKGLMDDDDDVPATGSTQVQITQQGPVPPPATVAPVTPYPQPAMPDTPVQAWPQQDPAVVTQPLQPPADSPRADPQH